VRCCNVFLTGRLRSIAHLKTTYHLPRYSEAGWMPRTHLAWQRHRSGCNVTEVDAKDLCCPTTSTSSYGSKNCTPPDPIVGRDSHAGTHICFIWVAQSYFFYQRNRSIVHGGQRDTLSEAVVWLRTAVTFVTLLISRTKFSASGVELVPWRYFCWRPFWEAKESCGVSVLIQARLYGVATVSRLLKIKGLFCKRAL